MKRLIRVKLPLNLDKKDTCAFINRNYELSPLKVFELSNVLITCEGICLINHNLVKESIHGYRDKITIYSLMSKLNVLNYKTVLLDNSNYYLLIQSPIFSYYHWLTESIPRLLTVKSRIKELTLFLPVSFRNIGFVRESLEPFSVTNIFYMPEKTNIKVNHLVLPQIKPFFTSFYPEVVNEIRDLYTEYSKRKYTNTGKTYHRLFLNDNIDNKPAIHNTNELNSLLDQYDVHQINILDYPFFEQVQLMQNAKFIISVSGDDLASISFAKKGTSILELLKAQTSEIDQPSLRYLNMASNLDLKYYYQLYTPLKNHSIYSQNKIYIDLNLFEKNLKIILAK
jgi:capsular polysaccharide biosynthesis protein